MEIKGVKDVHHIHLWSMDGINNYATMHVVTSFKSSDIKDNIREELKEHGITHVTIELENEKEKCSEIKCHVEHESSHHHHHHHH